MVTPTLSCPEIRDAWREALTTPLELPLGLGSNPRLLNVRGDAVIVGGQVNGRLVQRVFPHGLEGDSFALPPVSEGAMPLLAELTEERVVYGELWDSASPRRWRFHVQHGPDAEPRLLVDSRDSHGVAGPYPFWVEGDFLRWFEVVNASGDAPERQRVMQVALNDPDAAPQVALEVEGESGYPVLLDDRIVFGQNDTWRAYDRTTLRETSAPSAMPPAGHWKAQRGNEVLYDRDNVDGVEELVLVDVMTGRSRPILKGAASNMVTIEGDSALVLRGRTVTLVDLVSGNELEIMDDNGTTEGMQVAPVLMEEFVLRITDGANGDPGSMARLSDLPTAIPNC